jgi:hypothetical protein
MGNELQSQGGRGKNCVCVCVYKQDDSIHSLTFFHWSIFTKFPVNAVFEQFRGLSEDGRGHVTMTINVCKSGTEITLRAPSFYFSPSFENRIVFLFSLLSLLPPPPLPLGQLRRGGQPARPTEGRPEWPNQNKLAWPLASSSFFQPTLR